jgi:hypothetical protein
MRKAVLLLPAMLVATAAAAATTPLPAAFFDKTFIVPEPSTMILLAAGAGMLGIAFRKKK